MNRQAIVKQLENLQNEMRILILQNRQASQEYDEDFLVRVHNLSARMIWLRRQLRTLNEKESLVWHLKKDLTNA